MYVMNEGFQRAAMGYGAPRGYGRRARGRYQEAVVTPAHYLDGMIGSPLISTYNVCIRVAITINGERIEAIADGGKPLMGGQGYVFLARNNGRQMRITLSPMSTRWNLELCTNGDSGCAVFDLTQMGTYIDKRKGMVEMRGKAPAIDGDLMGCAYLYSVILQRRD